MKKEQKTEPEFCMKPEAVRDGLYTLRTKCLARDDSEPYLQYKYGEWGNGVQIVTESIWNILRDAEILLGRMCDIEKENKALRLLLEWAVECDFGYDQFYPEYKKYKDKTEGLGYIEGMIEIAKCVLAEKGGKSDG